MTSDDENCACHEEIAGEACVDGTVYGYCASEYCYGVCELLNTCSCVCHGK